MSPLPIMTSCRMMPQVSSSPVQVFMGPEQLFPMLWQTSHWRDVTGERKRTRSWVAVVKDLTSPFTDILIQHLISTFHIPLPLFSLFHCSICERFWVFLLIISIIIYSSMNLNLAKWGKAIWDRILHFNHQYPPSFSRLLYNDVCLVFLRLLRKTSPQTPLSW